MVQHSIQCTIPYGLGHNVLSILGSIRAKTGGTGQEATDKKTLVSHYENMAHTVGPTKPAAGRKASGGHSTSATHMRKSNHHLASRSPPPPRGTRLLHDSCQSTGVRTPCPQPKQNPDRQGPNPRPEPPRLAPAVWWLFGVTWLRHRNQTTWGVCTWPVNGRSPRTLPSPLRTSWSQTHTKPPNQPGWECPPLLPLPSKTKLTSAEGRHSFSATSVRLMRE